MDRVVISSGHSKYVSGAVGYINEVAEARKVVDRVASLLPKVGVHAVKFHDNTSKNVRDNINTIVAFHNKHNRDLDVSVHFNAGTKSIGGVEVLYLTDNNRKLSADVSKAISDALGIRNRGAKKRTDLGFLNYTKKDAILIEVCFVDTKSNVDAYHAHFDEMCIAIVESLSGRKMKEETPMKNNETYQKHPDYIGTTFEDAVNFLKEEGLINGYPNGDFGINDNLTRGHFALVMERLVKKLNEK